LTRGFGWEGNITYDAILIDEGQDFDEDMVQAVARLLNPKTNSLLFCYDPAQNVFGRKAPVWKRIGINVQGKRPTILNRCYRSTSEIVSLASLFMGFEDVTSDEFDSPLFPKSVDRHGKLPRLSHFQREDEQIKFILRGIDHYINKANCEWGDIGVIYAKPGHDFALKFQRSFAAHFGVDGADKFYWINQDNRNQNAQASAVNICRIESCKGLEFRVVFLVGIDYLPREGRDMDAEKKLIYVGITRAQEALHILTERDGVFVRQLQATTPSA
jgi:superfamily I DNA/RNA helicase